MMLRPNLKVILEFVVRHLMLVLMILIDMYDL